MSIDSKNQKAEKMLSDVLKGLLSKPKTLPCKYFYDKKGSNLFQKICQLPEYYLTRTETALLETVSQEIAYLIGPECQLIELGSGSSNKMEILLNALIKPKSFTAVDISEEHLFFAIKSLSKKFPDLEINGICTDFLRPFSLPKLTDDSIKVGFFPGSTIGNFNPKDANIFLQGTRDIVGKNGGMIVGVDLKKNEQILHDAYNDSNGITAEFNMNLLVRLNSELGANFDLDQFCHKAFYNNQLGRIEMHLKSLSEQSIKLGSEVINFERGETIHTENSYKYSINEFSSLAHESGYETIKSWCDQDNLFGIFFLQAIS